MLSFSRSAVSVIRSTALFLFASLLAHSATVTVTPTVSSLGGGVFQYAYSISNSGPDDAFLIDLPVPSDPSAVTNLSAPVGFKSQFDSISGLASFLEDSDVFTSSPLSGFSFDSPGDPSPATFTASLLDSSLNIYTLSGSTLAPIVTPEPSYTYLFGFMTTALLFLVRRNARVGASLLVNTQPLEDTHASGK